MFTKAAAAVLLAAALLTACTSTDKGGAPLAAPDFTLKDLAGLPRIVQARRG